MASWLTQEQLADALGLTSVHVNRTNRAVRIGDWKKLAEAGDFESNYLHLTRPDSAGPSIAL